MSLRLLALVLERETDIVLVRKRTRRVAELLGFDGQEQTRITTAVSEIARNAFDYAGGGRAEFRLLGEAAPQTFEIAIIDCGPGIPDLDAVLSGEHHSKHGMGAGLAGARRLMDDFAVEAMPGRGTTVRLGKRLPARAPLATKAGLQRIARALAADDPADPIEELRQQNHAMIIELEELHDRQADLERLNQELQDTNRGVVALYAELDERADHLKRADELKSRFLSNMSHEFRTPLNSILALSRLLLTGGDGDLGEEQKKQVQFIRKAAENLTELVNDLLDIAKVEAGKTVVTAAEVTVESLFGALRGMLRPLLVGDAVALVFEDSGDLPTLFTDEGKVSQILRNFISNAIKFTEEGEVRVWATANPADDTVSFSVRDTGIGIAEEDLDIIFQEFSQITHPIQARIKGTGLGLPLARKLAELLGGRIDVESAVGQGSVFRVTIPRIYPQAGEAASEEDWQLEPGRIPVLAIEDDAADAFALERSLAGSRYQPLPARSIAQARRVMERVPPEAVLVDVMLHGEEAWRFVIELRQRRETSDLPIVVISSISEERKALSLGADEYVRKPADPPQLLALLDRLTGHRSVVKVLLIDDEEVSRYLVRQLLPRGSFALAEAATAVEGIERMRDMQPDLVLLDLDMPGMSGYRCLQRIAEEPGLDAIPVVIITAAVLGPEERRRLGRAARIVTKSEMTSRALIEAIREAVGGMLEQATP